MAINSNTLIICKHTKDLNILTYQHFIKFSEIENKINRNRLLLFYTKIQNDFKYTEKFKTSNFKIVVNSC